MNEDDILDGVIKSVNDTDVKISIWDFYLKKATNIETNDSDGMGYCNFSIKVEDPNNKFYMYYSSDDFKSTGEMVLLEIRGIQEIQVTRAHQAVQVHRITHLVVQVLRQIAQVHQAAQILTQQLQQELQIQQMVLHQIQIQLNQYH